MPSIEYVATSLASTFTTWHQKGRSIGQSPPPAAAPHAGHMQLRGLPDNGFTADAIVEVVEQRARQPDPSTRTSGATVTDRATDEVPAPRAPVTRNCRIRNRRFRDAKAASH